MGFLRPKRPDSMGKVEGPEPVRNAREESVEPEEADGRDAIRAFSCMDGEWVARVIGSGRSGSLPDSGASILLIAFSQADEPDLLLSEAYAVGRSLRDFNDLDLEALLRRARPYRASIPTEDGGISGSRGR